MSKTGLFRITVLAGLIAVGGAAAYAKGPGTEMRFQEIDANSDGSITVEEVRAHQAARFARADTNGDGFLTESEMRGSSRAQQMMKRYDLDRNGSLDESELEKAGSDRLDRRAARMMQRVDANGDGKLSLDEASARRDPTRMFERLDANSDGALSAEEFAKAAGKRRHRQAD